MLLDAVLNPAVVYSSFTSNQEFYIIDFMKRTKRKGGLRKTKPLKLQTQRLLAAIYAKLDGPFAAARLCNHSPQALNHWKHLGRVPLQEVGDIARAWNIPKAALNYFGVESYEDKVASIKELVAKIGFSEKISEWILKGEEPQGEV